MHDLHHKFDELKQIRREIEKLTAKVRRLKIERNCLRAEVESYKLSDQAISQLTIDRLKEGLPQPINAES